MSARVLAFPTERIGRKRTLVERLFDADDARIAPRHIAGSASAVDYHRRLRWWELNYTWTWTACSLGVGVDLDLPDDPGVRAFLALRLAFLTIQLGFEGGPRR